MISQDDELILIGFINENNILEKDKTVGLKEIKSVFYDLVQVGPMYRIFHDKLIERGLIKADADINTAGITYA